MDLETPATETPATPPPAAPTETPAANPEPATSIADHAESLAKANGAEPGTLETDTRASNGRFKPSKHRASSQVATSRESPRIAELTKKYRTTEQERDALKAENEALKAAKATAAPQTAVQAVSQEPPRTRQDAPGATNGAFSDPEPKLEDFAASEDPYGALLRAQGRWDRAKERFEEQQQAESTRSAREETELQARALASYNTRAVEFKKTHPDFDAVIEAAPVVDLTPVMRAALLGSDNGPQFVYALAQHPDWQYEMHLLTDGKAVTDQAVASAQRMLNLRVQAASTGSVASPLPPPLVPKPPNPVRTGPMTTVVETAETDTGTLASHAKKYVAPTRRR